VNESGAARATVSTLNAVSTVDSTAPSKAADASLKRGTSSFPVTDAGAALSEQNDLFAKAVTLRQSGRLGEALSAYEEVIRRFPNGALAESASGEHLRLLIKTDPTRARAEARVYLARYPRGFAAREAQALLGAP
jgi:TolA-binding protein